MARASQRDAVSGTHLRLAVTAQAVRRVFTLNGLDRVIPVSSLGPRSWNDSWNGSPDNPSAASAISAISRAIGAASACAATARASRNA